MNLSPRDIACVRNPEVEDDNCSQRTDGLLRHHLRFIPILGRVNFLAVTQKVDRPGGHTAEACPLLGHVRGREVLKCCDLGTLPSFSVTEFRGQQLSHTRRHFDRG